MEGIISGKKNPDETTTEKDNKKSQNIIETLPSRQIASWKMKSRQKGKARRQKSYDGKVYMPIDAEAVFEDIAEQSPANVSESVQTLSMRLVEKRRLRSSSMSSARSLSSITTLCYIVSMAFKRSYQRVRDFLKMFELWIGHFKEIEGTFGNGILSFFTFLRWLLYVNMFVFTLALIFLIIPQAVYKDEVPARLVTQTTPLVNATTNSSTAVQQNDTTRWSAQDVPENAGFLGANTSLVKQRKGCDMVRPDTNYASYDIGLLISDFMQGVGWINTTLMFYGSYSDRILVMPTDVYYNMPLAYFSVSTLSFVVVLLLTLWSASSLIEDNYVKDGVKHYNSYSNKVFGGWDMCISDESAAALKKKAFVHELEGDLAEDLRLATVAKRTRSEKIKIYCLRITINIIVLLLSLGAGWAIYQAAQLSLKAAQSDVNTTVEKFDFMSFFKSYASSITLTVINSIIPTLFYFLSRLEDWNPRVRVNIDLVRTVLFKLSSVAVLMISLFEKIESDCMLCWENAIAAEMYKLIWMDFVVVLAVVIAYHIPRRYAADKLDFGVKLGQKIGRPIFSIPQNVLELVYAQCLIWIGMFYSPLLTLMGCVKLFILFYIKKLNLKYNCRSEDKAYRAGKSNYFFMLLLLATFFLCVSSVLFGVSQIYPSLLYGPFRGLTRMYTIVPLTVLTLPISFQDFFKVVESPVFVIVVVLLICLGLYFFYATAKVYSRMIAELREELSMETKDKNFLLKKLTTQ